MDFRHYYDYYLGFPSNIVNSEPSQSQSNKGNVPTTNSLLEEGQQTMPPKTH
jgi:hypothetical protein